MRSWNDPSERRAALELDYQTFQLQYPDRSEESWRKFRKRAEVEQTLATPEVVDAIEAAALAEAQRDAQAAFRERVDARRRELVDQAIARDVKEAVSQQARHEELLTLLREEMARVPAIDVPPLVIPPSKHTPEQATLVVSDAHLGKLVREEFVGEGFRYDLSIFKERLTVLEEQVESICSLHEQMYPLARLNLMFLGDMVDGVDMRRGHGLRVEVNSAVKQAMIVATEFAAFTARLRARRNWQVFAEWLDGNHGRVGEYGVSLGGDNWDYVAALMYEQAVSNLPDVKVRLRTQKFDLLKLGPMTVYASHGDGQTKGDGGFAGIPFYGIVRSAAKDTGLHARMFDLFIHGHYHQRYDIPFGSARIFGNGAWDGGDDFSVNGLKAASTPEQWFFGVHPRRGMTWRYPIQIAPARDPSPVFETVTL